MDASISGPGQAGRMLGVAAGLAGMAAPIEAAALRRLLLAHGEAEPIVLDQVELAAVAGVREGLLAVFGAAGADQAATAVNQLLARAGCRPRLSNHDGSPWHLHVTDEDAPWADWLAAGAGMALAGLLAEDGMARIGRCAAPGCGRPFAGGRRNHPRRHCSPACANRARVAAHRARRRGVGGAPEGQGAA
jgi:predicted RNA-binding Zn ribbon-like protein